LILTVNNPPVFIDKELLKFSYSPTNWTLAACHGSSFALLLTRIINTEMKTAEEMLDERLTIQDGHLKGARITISESLARELMEEYHFQFLQEMELQVEEGSNRFKQNKAS
jgi:hypothetical protein